MMVNTGMVNMRSSLFRTAWKFAVVILTCVSLCLASPSCQPVTLTHCVNVVNVTQLPNIYGHYNQNTIAAQLSPLFKVVNTQCPLLTRFLCLLHLPSCPPDSPHKVTPLPCRQVCEGARDGCKDILSDNADVWPYDIQCRTLPTERCLHINDDGSPVYIETSLHATGAPRHTNSLPESLAPLETELGDNEEYSIEVVSMTSNQIPLRRYDVIELGDEDLFLGWADVQGLGAANDYCRILGKGKRRFLSCALAGSTGQGHQYVSKLGFDVGHKQTWFMRDVDNDGRDDYCRCVGRPDNSRISCMKAGEKSFYGSTIQGGSQYSFDLPGSARCQDKRLNPQFGA